MKLEFYVVSEDETEDRVPVSKKSASDIEELGEKIDAALLQAEEQGYNFSEELEFVDSANDEIQFIAHELGGGEKKLLCRIKGFKNQVARDEAEDYIRNKS